MGERIDLVQLGRLAPRQMVDEEDYPGLEDAIAMHPTSHGRVVTDPNALDAIDQATANASWGDFLEREDLQDIVRQMGSVPLTDLAERS